MEATKSDWILVRCECRLGEPAATIVACSTRAHRGLCATLLRVPMGCTRLAVFATNMAEPARSYVQPGLFDLDYRVCGRPNATLLRRFCLWISSWVSRPNAGRSQCVTRNSRLPDDVTFNDLQPRMLCAMCDHRGADVSRHGCIMADWSPEIADPLVHAHVGLLQPIHQRFLLGSDLCGKRRRDSFVEREQLVDRH
jgi:hypothetical protein